MIPIERALLFSVLLLAGCGSSMTDRSLTGATPAAAMPAEEKPEPLPAGVKPLTLEQEEMISQ